MSKKYVLQRVFNIMLILMAFSCVLLGCNSKNYLDFTDDILVCYQTTPAYHSEYSVAKNIIIYNNGKGVYEEKTISGKYHASVEFEIDENHITTLQNVIARVNFMELDEDISTDSCDGDYKYITVYADDTSHKSGGLNPNTKRFTRLEDVILTNVPDDVVKECDEKLKNSLPNDDAN